jgi:hypothetical protein
LSCFTSILAPKSGKEKKEEEKEPKEGTINLTEIKEMKDTSNFIEDSSLGKISIPQERKDFSVDSSLGKISFPSDSKIKASDRPSLEESTLKVMNLAKKFEMIEDLKLKNELFNVLSYIQINKSSSKTHSFI